MWTSIGDTLPLAIGLALSPFAIVTGIVLLLGTHGRAKTAMFGLGWFAAILTIAAIAFWVVEAAEEASSEYATGRGHRPTRVRGSVLRARRALLGEMSEGTRVNWW